MRYDVFCSKQVPQGPSAPLPESLEQCVCVQLDFKPTHLEEREHNHLKKAHLAL